MRSPNKRSDFAKNVFINCPFDQKYVALLRPLLFTVTYLGFNPRIATERSDSSENRVDKIIELIRDSQFSIHDISRLQATSRGEFSRFNLPFELGLSHGSRIYGPRTNGAKRCLILEKDPYAFQRALSDLSGADIKSHGNEPQKVVRSVRDWFVETAGLRGIAAPTKIWYRFNDFTSAFYDARKLDGFSRADLNIMPIPEYIDFIRDWVAEQRS